MSESTEIANPMNLPPEVLALMQESAKSTIENEKSTVPWLSIKGGKFSLLEQKLGKSLKVVILAATYDNIYYDRPYDPDNTASPACFAIAEHESDLIPHESSPVEQHASCLHCPRNKFGTAENGKGKACKNGRRLLLAAVGEDGIKLNELAVLRLPPTSMRNYSTYAKTVASRTGLPLWAIVTQLDMDEDEDFAKVMFSIVPDITIPKDSIVEVSSRRAEFTDIVLQPYDTSSYEPPEEAPSKQTKSKMS